MTTYRMIRWKIFLLAVMMSLPRCSTRDRISVEYEGGSTDVVCVAGHLCLPLFDPYVPDTTEHASGITVRLLPADYNPMTDIDTFDLSAVTDSGGNYSISGVCEEKIYTLNAIDSATGLTLYRNAVHIPLTDERFDLGDDTLLRTGQVVVNLRDSSGAKPAYLYIPGSPFVYDIPEGQTVFTISPVPAERLVLFCHYPETDVNVPLNSASDTIGVSPDSTAYAAISNTPPVITTTSAEVEKNIAAGALYTCTVRAVDPDSDSVAFKFAACPYGMNMDGSTGIVRWQSSPDDTGMIAVRVIAYDVWGGRDTIAWNIAMEGPAEIVNQPYSMTVYANTGATFSISAIGGTGLIYQWQHDTRDIEGADDSAYAITGAVKSDSGTYRCIVSNAYGNDTSADAFFQVLDSNETPVIQSVTIAVSPEAQLRNAPFRVNATISTTSDLRSSTVEARLLTCFPDFDIGAIAVFHLDGDLVNACNRTTATGLPGYTTTDMLFGSAALNQGRFDCSLPQFADAFVIEAWVKPGSTGAATFFSSSGIQIGVNAGMKLFLQNEATILDTAVVPVGIGEWSHIGIARNNGHAFLFQNGVAVSDPIDFASPLSGGIITVSVPTDWVIDEVRCSKRNEIIDNSAVVTLSLPSVPAPAWIFNTGTISSAVAQIAPSAWISGTGLGFSFACADTGRVILNIRQRQGGIAGAGWSENGNPVSISE